MRSLAHVKPCVSASFGRVKLRVCGWCAPGTGVYALAAHVKPRCLRFVRM